MNILGTGIDIVEIARIAASIERHGDRFLARIFTAAERTYCAGMKAPHPFYAARFAAKESVAKAFGTGITGQLGWQDIEVRRKASGAPFVVLHGKGAATAKRLGIVEIHLSLSHSEHYAIAHAVVVGESAG